ncbi:hypothetical protein KDA_35690 [Dictyobacter alpinus]|uniref:Uncharacterized protein n=1 Tax=Dictyobacter alpinus TaxID=2014873 RepID=A0A402B9R3_9CHLR|nr:hypothetical protein KDA_35690 [Dictyobacter alpinus]
MYALAVSMVAKCMRLCVPGMTIILNGMQRNTAWRSQPKWVVSRDLRATEAIFCQQFLLRTLA